MRFANTMWLFKKRYSAKSFVFASLAFSLVIISSCNKNNTPKEEEPIAEDPNHRSKFVDTITTTTSTNPLFAGNSRDNNVFYVIQKQNNGSYNLHKCDDNGGLTFTKILNLGTEQLIEIEGAESTDDFYTLSGSYNFSQPGAAINAYVYGVFNKDSTTACGSAAPSDFYFNSSFIPSNEQTTPNNSVLRKFSQNGTEIWNKQLDGNYFQGNAIETDAAGNVYVLTATRSGYLPYQTSVGGSTVAPYYNFKLDSNYFSLYKFDVNGTQVFKTTITNVFEGIPGQFKPSLVLSKYNVGVFNSNNLYFFDLNGNLVSSNKPIKNTCYNYILSAVGNIRQANIIVQGNINYVSGSSSPKYFEAFNPGGFSLLFYHSYGSPISKMSREGELFIAAGNSITKFDRLGGLIYTKIYDPSLVMFNNSNTLPDKFSNIYSFVVIQNKILVYKFGANGNYN